MTNFKVYIPLLLTVIFCFSCTDNDTSITPVTLTGELEWQKTFGGSNDDIAQGVIETNDGGYAVIGLTKSIDGDITDKLIEENDFWVLKLNSDGVVEWQKTYGGSGDDQGRAIIQTNDGGYAITGPSKSDDGDGSNNEGQHDHWIVKLDNQGTIQWERSFGFAGHDHSRSIIQTNDGGFFIGGYLDVDASGGSGNETVSTKHGVGEFWAQKLDPNGNLEWRRYFGGTNNDRIFNVLQAHDGNYLLVGASESTDFDIKNGNGSYDFWVIKIDTKGTMLWEKSYGGSGIDQGRAAIKTNDGNYIIVGAAISSDGNISNSKGNSDAWVIKIDENGTMLWEKSFGGSGFDAAFAIDNGKGIFSSYVIAGNSKSSDGDTSKNNGENDFWVIKIDNSGKLLFEKSLGGSGLDFAHGVIETSDQKIVVVGETESSDMDVAANHGKKDIWIAKIK